MTEERAALRQLANRRDDGAVLVISGVDRMTYDMIEDAAEQVQSGGGSLRSRYIGLKDYDRFSGQREDHRYGYGPKHGHIVAQIGLAPSLQRCEALTREQIVTAMQVLDGLAAVVPMTRRSR